MTVWIVSKGNRNEGGEVSSVHATRDSALAVVDKLLTEHRNNLDQMREEAKSEDDPFWESWLVRSQEWGMKKQSGDRWVSNVDFIEIREWLVVEETP
jgi:hypothetical protein